MPKPIVQHPDKLRWNERYTNVGIETFASEPSSWLVQHEDLLRKQPNGPALDVAAGTGRHAFYLAGLGFTVDAIDISDVAIAWIQEQARQRQTTVLPKVADLETHRLAMNRYQVIVNVNYLERNIFGEIEAALRPGGLLFFETMSADHIDVLGHRISRDFTLEPNELLRAFSSLHVLEFRERIVRGSDGKQSAVSSLIGRKVEAWAKSAKKQARP